MGEKEREKEDATKAGWEGKNFFVIPPPPFPLFSLSLPLMKELGRRFKNQSGQPPHTSQPKTHPPIFFLFRPISTFSLSLSLSHLCRKEERRGLHVIKLHTSPKFSGPLRAKFPAGSIRYSWTRSTGERKFSLEGASSWSIKWGGLKFGCSRPIHLWANFDCTTVDCDVRLSLKEKRAKKVAFSPSSSSSSSSADKLFKSHCLLFLLPSFLPSYLWTNEEVLRCR